MSKYYNIGDTVGYWTLTYNSKKSPASIGGGMNCYSLHKSFFSGGGKDGK